jgi:putative transposase
MGRGGLQTAFRFRTWGGARRGAGRKRSRRRRVPHRRRERLKPRWPVHITLRCVREVGRLRKFKLYQRLREAMAGASARVDFSICQYSVQGDHIHLICEAHSERALANGMRSLQNRITKKLKKLLILDGSAFDGRYHAHILKTPRTVRNALAYVLLNARKHGEHRRAGSCWTDGGASAWIDPYSSAYYFDGWRDVRGGRLGQPPPGSPPVAPATSWLLSDGWRVHGLLSPLETPGS